jgi:delta 1-pyrroline-5-carboxylate dehydrogenase
MTDTNRLVIGGDLVEAASGETFESIDPSTGEVFATVAKAGQEDVRRAAEAARQAFDQGPWPRMKGRDRAAALLQVADGGRPTFIVLVGQFPTEAEAAAAMDSLPEGRNPDQVELIVIDPHFELQTPDDLLSR